MSISHDPTLVALSQRLREQLDDDDIKLRLAKIRNSATWRRVEEFLTLRREQLYVDRPETIEQLWKREGALAEVQRLLLHGPTLVLQWQQWHTEASVVAPTTPPAPLAGIKSTDDGLG